MKDPKQLIKKYILKKNPYNKLFGGKADKKSPKDFDKDQLEAGIAVELEHTNDRNIAQEIAMDHLVEDPDYYTKLKQIHVEKSYINKTVPKGVNAEKYDRCIAEVKRQRSGKNAYAICSASLQGHAKKSEINTRSFKDKKLADLIRRHNQKKLNKSIDFHNTKSSIESSDQLLAEKTISPELIDYIKTSVSNNLSKIPFAKGVLTLSEKEKGLYNGFFQDNDGQIVEKFDSQTLEIIAKNMELKDLYNATHKDAAPNHDPIEEAEDRAIAQQEVKEALDEHNKLYHKDQKPGDSINPTGKSIKLKFGDFELEIKKSIKSFVHDFKKSKLYKDKDMIFKSLQSWRTKNKDILNLDNDSKAAKILLENWEDYKEDFNQILYGLTHKDD